jgi:hypothetical protein
MNSSAKKLTSISAIGLSLGLVVLLGLAPSTFAVTNTVCTNSALDSTTGNTYTISASLSTTAACNNLPLGTTASLTATTTDTTVTYVDFLVTNPGGTQTTSGLIAPTSPSTWTYAAGTLNSAGTWTFAVEFYSAVGPLYVLTVNISVQVLVLNELPLGTIAAASVALVGLVAVRKLSRNFSQVVPTS